MKKPLKWERPSISRGVPYVSDMVRNWVTLRSSSMSWNFGTSCMDVVQQVDGFEIAMDTQNSVISYVRNITRGLPSTYELSRFKLLFQLLPGECAVAIDVRFSERGGFEAIRFHTDKRSSVWLGHGSGHASKTLIVPQGHFLQSIYGRTSKDNHQSLGIVTLPIDFHLLISKTPASVVYSKAITAMRGSQEDWSDLGVVEDIAPDLCAVLVNYSDFTFYVLGRVAIEIIHTLDNHIVWGNCLLVEFTDGEEVQAVEAGLSQTEVLSLCFTTNLRKTAIIPISRSNDASGVGVVECPPGKRFCGFRRKISSNGNIKTLEVAFCEP